MKKLLIVIFILLQIFCVVAQFEIVDYNGEHKDGIIRIALQNMKVCFGGYELVERGLMSPATWICQIREGLASFLEDNTKITKVLIDSDKVAGFIIFGKFREISLESMKRQISQEQLAGFNEELLLANVPELKRFESECEFHPKIELLAVCKGFRRKGYGRMLIKDAINTMQALWPDIKQIRIEVSYDNNEAISLYVSEGFVFSSQQHGLLKCQNTAQYEKNLS